MTDVNKQLLDALKEIREFNLEFTWSPRIGELCNKAIAAAEQAQPVESVLNITFSGSLQGENLSDLLSEGSEQQIEKGSARMFLDPLRAGYLKTFIGPDQLTVLQKGDT